MSFTPPPIPADEARRLQSLRDLGILDTEAEERFDRITRLVQRILDVPMSAITLVDADRQWFKSRQGIDDPETSREHSFCAHAVAQEGLLYVPDAHEDDRFAGNPLVLDDPNVRAYAGAQIHAPDGAAIGTLCAIDDRPRELTAEDLQALEDLARMAEQEIAALNMAITDGLTGLANRRGLMTLGGKVLSAAGRMGFPVEMLFMDVDGLKRVNDELGHDRGDELLRDVAGLLEATFRESDVIARLGGDEFCVLLTGTATAGAEGAVVRLQAAIDQHNDAAGRPYAVAVSVGHAGLEGEESPDLEDLLRRSDAAMYDHKRSRRRR
ncbi:MAG TPA: sensor domain-containing diguanylate cyclase [Thermoleophilaceae bacterium]|nr:sensor domain-containing diguanylate cyclase [Thermoleophilaceae bacterium]